MSTWTRLIFPNISTNCGTSIPICEPMGTILLLTTALTQCIRLVWQAALPAESPCWPQDFVLMHGISEALYAVSYCSFSAHCRTLQCMIAAHRHDSSAHDYSFWILHCYQQGCSESHLMLLQIHKCFPGTYTWSRKLEFVGHEIRIPSDLLYNKYIINIQ